ncbi:GNAT family N-acetyltransferase [Pseudomonas sp. TAE6080]|uniref:GNAT family N-acetyltransferase n=1 Tax=Pseudomonas sp. TAE6080 TaxID=2840374 RepID=UPI001C003D0B|nr:GNAT family N-acetyltransferase [Pseudomonas sp. TAE6080]MBT9300652.1 GNAT family N-acetyltransferase [Pseudomonas sp. TAE6080]
MNLESKTVRLRLIEENDAGFVLKLRLDKNYNQFLSSVAPSIEAQREWINKYKSDEQKGAQYYFIIERLDGVPCGTVRLYDFKGSSFSWGSWILNEDKTRFAALESAFLVYQFAFEHLEFEKSHFEVRKGNDRVISFHEKMGAFKTGETELDYLFEIKKDAVNQTKARLSSKI